MFDVFYKRGSGNAAADALSRITSEELQRISTVHEKEFLVTTRLQARKNTASIGNTAQDSTTPRIDHPPVGELLSKPEIEFRKQFKPDE